ncbi:MAG: ribonuclease III family protein, partial [Steroidobacteraceae bacterium]
TAQFLMERFPEKREGELSKLRAYLVSARHLTRVAQGLGLGEYLRLGRGEERSGGRHKSALLADTLEAVLAALYLDGGMETARLWVGKTILEPELAQLEGAGLGTLPLTDYKSALQEAAQALGWPQPQYRIAKEAGPDHRKVFTVEVQLSSEPNHTAPVAVQARAEGRNKKSAEQDAARQALEQLQSQRQRAEATQ